MEVLGLRQVEITVEADLVPAQAVALDDGVRARITIDVVVVGPLLSRRLREMAADKDGGHLVPQSTELHGKVFERDVDAPTLRTRDLPEPSFRGVFVTME
jgi:hypothetical protein